MRGFHLFLLLGVSSFFSFGQSTLTVNIQDCLGSFKGKVVLSQNGSKLQSNDLANGSTVFKNIQGASDSNNYSIECYDSRGLLNLNQEISIPEGSNKKIFFDRCSLVTVITDDDPQLDFAISEIRKAITKPISQIIELNVKLDKDNPEAYEIKIASDGKINVIGSDVSGAMYGAMDVAEYKKLGLVVTEGNSKPYILKRGIKFNIPLDARNPSYDGSGDSENNNTQHMWDFEGFWKPYLDELARNKYNVLSLWTTHEFPHMVDLKLYPDINTGNNGIYKVKDGVLNAESKGKYIVSKYRFKGKGYYEEGFLDTNEGPGVLGNDNKGRPVRGDGFVDLDKIERVDGVNGIPAMNIIQDKVAHWKAVFKHAKERGIEIGIMHWNVFAYGAKGKYGIEESQDDAKFTEYLRYAVKELILTYPEITTVGVAAGENDNEKFDPKVTTEEFIYESYGKGVQSALAEQPGRKVKFIWRNHSTKIEDVDKYFTSKYDPEGYNSSTEKLIGVSIKYTIGRLYSSRRLKEYEVRSIKRGGWLNPGKNNGYSYNTWLNIRNDDIFMHRWGSADYVREFIKNMPQGNMLGFLMGSDGYVWGKEFISKVPELKGQLEVKKHWYNFSLWGKLAYNNELTDAYWKKILASKYDISESNADLLFEAWQEVSEVVPQLHRQTWASTDAGIAAEGCMSSSASSTGFLTFDKLFLNQEKGVYKRFPTELITPHVGNEKQCWPVRHWVDAGKPKLSVTEITPSKVADKLDEFADAVNGGSTLNTIRAASSNIEYQDMLLDLESMAELGRYYADKLRCSISYYEWYSTGKSNDALHEQAVRDIKNSQAHWENYARVLDTHYNPFLTGRTHYMDWNSILNNGKVEYNPHRDSRAEGVKREVKDVIDKKFNPDENPKSFWKGPWVDN